MEHPWKETLQADQRLPKTLRLPNDSLPGLNTVHLTLHPSHATNTGKLAVEY